MAEKQIEDRCRTYALKHGWSVLKLNPAGRIGTFDRLYLGPEGKVFFCEHKQPGGRKRRHQIIEQERLRRLGFTAEFCYTFALFVELFNQVRRPE